MEVLLYYIMIILAAAMNPEYQCRVNIHNRDNYCFNQYNQTIFVSCHNDTLTIHEACNYGCIDGYGCRSALCLPLGVLCWLGLTLLLRYKRSLGVCDTLGHSVLTLVSTFGIFAYLTPCGFANNTY